MVKGWLGKGLGGGRLLTRLPTRAGRGRDIRAGQVPTGQYRLNEFGGRGRQGSVRRGGRLWGWGWLGSLTRTGLKTGHYRGSLIRIGLRGGLEVVEVLVDGIADGPAPGIGAEGVNVLVLGK